MNEAVTQRSRCIIRSVTALKTSLGGTLLNCLDACWAKNTALVDALGSIENAILCVLACTMANAETDPISRKCIDACLQECEGQLKEAHESFLQACIDDCLAEEKKKELKYPNEPYNPQATRVSINYAAHCSIQTTESEEACGLFYHLLPFGGYYRVDTSTKRAPALLPEISSPGNLYIGLSQFAPSQTLTLLFEMAAQNASQPPRLPPARWDYLSGNKWIALQAGQIRADSTGGLQNSGVVSLSLPSYDPLNNTVLSGDYGWLRASTPKKPGGFPDSVAVYAQAGLATWQNIDNTGETLREPLPPHSIVTSIQELPDIGRIDQPMESFGGRPPENEREFKTRVGERLRHKDRGILGWDYERLVLERFPAIWKVQALPARNTRGGSAPGDLLVVVVPGPDSAQMLDPTAPAASSELLAAIQAYLEGMISPFVALQVVNPVYVRVKVTTTVAFRSGGDRGSDIDRLNQELIEYLSPWYYSASRALTEGEYASESDISAFIQTRPYVSAMYTIELARDPDPRTLEWYFLTSSRAHVINVAAGQDEPRNGAV
jgi:hypothetical protein